MFVGRKLLHAPQDLSQSDLARMEHRSAALQREAITGEIDHVDVGGAQRDTLFENLRAFVDQRIQQPLDDLRVGQAAHLHPERLAFLVDDCVHHGIGNGVALARLVAIPAKTGFLTEAAEFADAIGNAHVAHLRMLGVVALADVPADVIAGQVGHAKRAHREAEALDGLVHLLW